MGGLSSTRDATEMKVALVSSADTLCSVWPSPQFCDSSLATTLDCRHSVRQHCTYTLGWCITCKTELQKIHIPSRIPSRTQALAGTFWSSISCSLLCLAWLTAFQSRQRWLVANHDPIRLGLHPLPPTRLTVHFVPGTTSCPNTVSFPDNLSLLPEVYTDLLSHDTALAHC